MSHIFPVHIIGANCDTSATFTRLVSSDQFEPSVLVYKFLLAVGPVVTIHLIPFHANSRVGFIMSDTLAELDQFEPLKLYLIEERFPSSPVATQNLPFQLTPFAP